MQNLVRCHALLRQKLFRPEIFNFSFKRFRQIGLGFSGPAATEAAVGDYRPLTAGWNEESMEGKIPGEVDLAVIGGGLVGLCSAFFIKHKFPRSFNVAVIEKDPSVRFLQRARVYRISLLNAYSLLTFCCTVINYRCTNYC